MPEVKEEVCELCGAVPIRYKLMGQWVCEACYEDHPSLETRGDEQYENARDDPD